MKQLGQLLLGIVLFGLGIFLLLSNISVSSLSFYSFGRVSTAPILIILLIVFIVLSVAANEKFILLVVLDLIGIIVSVIMGTHFFFRYMSALDLVLMLGTFAVGLGLIIKVLFGAKNDK